MVTRDVPAYHVAGGNPARVIKPRFESGLIDLLQRLRWWDLEGEELAKLLPLLCSSDLDEVKEKIAAYLEEHTFR